MLLVYATDSTYKLYEKQLQRYGVDMELTTCEGLDSSMPVVIRIPQTEFYHHVPVDRIADIHLGHADDLKIQTARLFDVTMKNYVSRPIYRALVQDFQHQATEIEQWDKENLRALVQSISTTTRMAQEDIANAIKMAIVKTTKSPPLEVILTAYGKKESLKRIDKHLRDYKDRIG